MLQPGTASRNGVYRCRYKSGERHFSSAQAPEMSYKKEEIDGRLPRGRGGSSEESARTSRGEGRMPRGEKAAGGHGRPRWRSPANDWDQGHLQF